MLQQGPCQLPNCPVSPHVPPLKHGRLGRRECTTSWRRSRGVACRASEHIVPVLQHAQDLPHISAFLLDLVQHKLPLASEPVALPCSMMKCGDVVHRRLVGVANLA
jgi:hypothetical protein